MSAYFIYKFLHIAGVIMWIGPPLGAFWMILFGFKKSPSSNPELEETIEKRLRKAFIGILIIEHIGLLILIAGALGMIHETGLGFINLFWVKSKIYIFILVIIPIEILDILWGQIWPGRLMKRQPEASISPELRKMFERYDRFTKICIPFLLISWAAIFYFAIFKPV